MTDTRRTRGTAMGWALLRQVRWVWPVLCLVLAGLCLLAVNAYRVGERLDNVQTAQADNVTWLVTQLEIEALKLDRALLDAQENPVGHDIDLRRSYDVYLSRVAIVAGSIEAGGVLAGLRDDPDWQEIRRLTRLLQLELDTPAAERGAVMQRARDQMVDLRRAIRRFIVAGLGLIVTAEREDRAGLRVLLNHSLLVSLGLIAMSLATGGMMFRLALQMRRMGHVEERARVNLERTLAASLDGVITSGADGLILGCNPAAAGIFGHTTASMVGMRLVDLLLPRGVMDAPGAVLARALESGLEGDPPEGRIEAMGRRLDGHAFPLEIALASDLSSEGRPVLYAFLRDISEKRSFETSLRAARDAALAAAEAKTRFLAVMSHEMRTPLNGVIAALEILRRTTRLSRRQGRFLGIAEGASALALEQINDVLELARLDGQSIAEERSDFNLVRLVREVADHAGPLAAKQGNRIELDLPPEAMAHVRGMKKLLQRVLINLVGNAAKFTRDGRIGLSVRLNPAGEDGLLATLSVADTGVGIAADQIDRIFEPFERLDTGYARASEGTGLGLGIVRRAVELMGGEIGLDSTPGRGSVFRVTLPLARAAPAVPDAGLANLPALAPLPRLSVLIVEDNPTNRIVLREMLIQLGQSLEAAEDGPQAERMAHIRRYDLIFMDISMPGQDGLETTRAIRAGGGASAGARIVGLTAHGAPDELRRFAAAGLPEVLVKPLTFAALEQFLRGAASASAIDETALADLRALLSAEALAQAVATFLAEGDAFIEALDRDPPAALAAQAHRLHGSCSLFGGVGLAAQLQDLERQLQDNPDDPVPPQHAQLSAAWHQLRHKVALALAVG